MDEHDNRREKEHAQDAVTLLCRLADLRREALAVCDRAPDETGKLRKALEAFAAEQRRQYAASLARVRAEVNKA